jgi:multisubunit Na+/H+ antiporter MnhG subunit
MSATLDDRDLHDEDEADINLLTLLLVFLFILVTAPFAGRLK